MFDRFTDRARKVMGLAKGEAERMHHGAIGTEHILLGLIREGTGVAANVLKLLNVDLKRVRDDVEKIASGLPNLVATEGRLPFTPSAKRVLERAVEEASVLGHRYLGTEHLLLGLIREAEGIGARVLLNLGLKLEEVREEILEFLGADKSRYGIARFGLSDESIAASRAARAVPVGEPDPLQRLSDRARNVVRLAKDEAKRRNHDYVSTEHLLLGLVAEGSGIAAHVLKRLNVDLQNVRSELERIVGRSPSIEVHGNLPFTPRAKAALDGAVDESRGLGHNYVGTEHLLLGLLREGEGIAALVLRNLGVNLAATREKIVEFLGGASGSAD